MRMRSDNGAHLAVEVPRYCHFLRCRFRVHIENDDLRFLFDLREDPVGSFKRTVDIEHVRASLKIRDGNFSFPAEIVHAETPSGIALRIIRGTKELRIVRENFIDVMSLPDVIPGGNDIDAETVQSFDLIFADAFSIEGILAVRDDEIDFLFLDEGTEQVLGDHHAGRADNITNK